MVTTGVHGRSIVWHRYLWSHQPGPKWTRMYTFLYRYLCFFIRQRWQMTHQSIYRMLKDSFQKLNSKKTLNLSNFFFFFFSNRSRIMVNVLKVSGVVFLHPVYHKVNINATVLILWNCKCLDVCSMCLSHYLTDFDETWYTDYDQYWAKHFFYFGVTRTKPRVDTSYN